MAKLFRTNTLSLSGKDMNVNTGDTTSFWRHDGVFANPLAGNPSGYLTSSSTGFLTGEFYPYKSNPSGYLTSTPIVGVTTVNITGSQISGDLIFTGAGSLTVSKSGQTITFSTSTGAGEANTASNLGSGQGIFAQKSSVDLQFYSLSGVGNNSISLSGNTIYISGTSTSTGSLTGSFYPRFLNPSGYATTGYVQTQAIIRNKAYTRYNLNAPSGALSFTTISGVYSGLIYYNVCWSSDKKICVAVIQSGVSATSSDGLNWTATATGAFPLLSGHPRICWSSETQLFVATTDTPAGQNSYSFARSSDGLTWTGVNAGSTGCTDICWSPQKGLFVATAAQYILYSSNGSGWNSTHVLPSLLQWDSVCWSPELGLFVAASNSITVAVSNDGITWTEYDQSFNVDTPCWSPELGMFVGFGNSSNNGLSTSTNGTGWNFSNIGTNNLADVCWSPELGLFVAVGVISGVYASQNGTTWIRTGFGLGLDSWNSVCWSPELGRFVVVGSSYDPGNISVGVSTQNFLSDSIPLLRGRIDNLINQTGISLTGSFYPRNTNPSNYITSGQTGGFVDRGMTGNFLDSGQTANFVTTGETRDLLMQGFTDFNWDSSSFGGLRYIANAVGGAGINFHFYPSVVTWGTSSSSSNTGLVIITTPINNTLFTNVTNSIRVYGYNLHVSSNTDPANHTGRAHAKSIDFTFKFRSDSTKVAFQDVGMDGYPKYIGTSGGNVVIAIGGPNSSWINSRFAIDLMSDGSNSRLHTGWGFALSSTNDPSSWSFVNTIALRTGQVVYPYITGIRLSGSNFVITNQQTGNFVTIDQTGNFVTTSQTGNFTTTDQTGNFITTAETGNFVTTAQTGSFITTSQTGNYVDRGQTGNFVTTGQTGSLTGSFYPLNSNPSGYVLSNQTGSFVTTAQTGNFVTTSQTGNYVDNGDTGNFVDSGMTGNFVNRGMTGNFVDVGRTGNFLDSGKITGVGNIATAMSGSSIIVSGASFYFVESASLVPGTGVGIANLSYIIPVFRANRPCTLTGVHVNMVSGTSTRVNAYKNVSGNSHLTIDQVVNTTGSWNSSGIISNSSYTYGDGLYAWVKAVTGAPRAITVQFDFTQP